jgi:hypothetical protein
MEIKDTEKNVYEELELLNALLIGFMVGTYDVLGKGGTQAVINMAGKTVAGELLRFARDKGIPLASLDDFKDFVTKYNLVGEIDFHEADNKTYVRITQCKTCPKKVGHYQFDGTACPWGGILSGVLSDIHGTPYSSASKLVPGEQCVIEVNKSSSTK